MLCGGAVKPPCILIGDRFLPALRQAVARILVLERGYSQSRAAELLGITQAMVSKYISQQPRADPALERDVSELARHIAQVIEEPEEATRALCSYCMGMRESARLCPLHLAATGQASCHVCMNLRAEDNPRNMVLRMMDQAVTALLQENIVSLIPQVRSNIAMCTERPAGPQDVASLPGRLIVVRGRLMSPTLPEFHASHHTTNLLLGINARAPALRSLINVRYGPDVLSAADALEFLSVPLPRESGALDVGAVTEGADCLLDRGDFGIEPCIYLVGRDALDVARKASSLHKALTTEGMQC